MLELQDHLPVKEVILEQELIEVHLHQEVFLQEVLRLEAEVFLQEALQLEVEVFLQEVLQLEVEVLRPEVHQEAQEDINIKLIPIQHNNTQI